MPSIFISYRRDDSAGHTGRLHDYLSQHFDEEDIFRDIDTIKPGEDFVTAVQNAVGNCFVLLAIIGRRWLTVADNNGNRRLNDPHDFVRLEIGAALQQNIKVIPVLVDGAVMPPIHELPADLEKLARLNAIEISDKRFPYDAGQLIETLKKLLVEIAPDTAILLQTPANLIEGTFPLTGSVISGSLKITEYQVHFDSAMIKIDILFGDIAEVRPMSNAGVIPNIMLIRTHAGKEYHFAFPVLNSRRSAVIDLIKQHTG